MKKLTKKQIREFAKIYISSQMYLLDGNNLGEIEVADGDGEKIIEEIHSQALKIGNGRSILFSPIQILNYILNNPKGINK